MLQAERQEKIIQYINDVKSATTDQMVEQFNVSHATIRRDIDLLAKNGSLIKVHGGAVALGSSSVQEIPFEKKVSMNADAKRLIGKKAAELIQPNDVIILDSGSTTLEVAKNITQPNVTILTNDIKISLELAAKPNIHIIVAGGTMDPYVYALTGNMTEDFFKRFHATKVFLGCDAIDKDFGISDRSYDEVQIKLAMMNSSDQVIAVTDSSKFGKKVFCYLCELREIDLIVTDQIDTVYESCFHEAGTEILLP